MLNPLAVGLAAVLLVGSEGRSTDRSAVANDPLSSRTLGRTVVASGVLVGVDPSNPNAPTIYLRTPKGEVRVALVTGFKTCAGLESEMELGTLQTLEAINHTEIVIYKMVDSTTPMLVQSLSANEQID